MQKIHLHVQHFICRSHQQHRNSRVSTPRLPCTQMIEWVCPTCTYANESHLVRCELCDTVRGGASGSGAAQRGQQHDVLVLDSEDEHCTREERAPKRQRKASAAPGAQAGPSTASADTADAEAGPTAAHDDPYVLDACSCKHMQQQLRTRLLQSLQAEGGVLSAQGSSGSSLEAAMASVCCPDCTQQLSHQDAYNLLDGSTLGKVCADEAYCAVVTSSLPLVDALFPQLMPLSQVLFSHQSVH